jgi:8-oxo-dGTP pyrophosphatase MutT (NUDIX family)
VIIYNEKGKILLVKDKKWGWNLPGGKIEENETPAEAAKREVFEETNLVLENYEKIGEKNVFYANLEKGSQHWKGYFYQASQYSGEIRIKEVGTILDIKFVDINSFSGVNDNQHSWRFYLEKIRSHE